MLVCVAVIVIAAVMSAGICADVGGVDIDNSILLEIQSGATGNAIVKQLGDAGVIRYPVIFKMKAKQAGQLTNFKPGTVIIEPGMSYDDIIERLASDNSTAVKVTIPEGYEMRQIAARLEDAGLVKTDEFYAAAKAENYDYDFLKGIAERENELEGYLFPDTYIISENASAHDIIDMMLSEFDKCFTDKYKKRADELGMTIDEVVTLASIIERETNAADERSKVSAVFHNRLDIDMRLQSCATVEYILEERKAKLTKSDLAVDSKYNTYKYAGLPVGPIASPGAACIEAALYPADITAKYFVLGKDGKHVFSDTYDGHLSAKNKAER